MIELFLEAEYELLEELEEIERERNRTNELRYQHC